MPERRIAAERAAPITPKHQTGIQWCHVPGYVGATWNPTTGCTRVSPGCDHCYAFALHDQRYKANRDAAWKHQRPAHPMISQAAYNAVARNEGASLPFPPQYDVPFSTVQVLGDERLTSPLRKRKPHAYFVDSMSDLFHEDVPDEVIDRVFAVMALSQYVGRCRRRDCDHEGFSCEGHLDPPTQHIFMILTKRPERMRDYINTPGRAGMVKAAQDLWVTSDHALSAMEWPLPRVWIGTSVEDQERADERIPLLLDTPAAVRFLSCEPLLGPVDLSTHLGIALNHDDLAGLLSWVIVGGESGKGARPFDLAWARSLRDQCAAAGVPFFMKQAGAWPYESDFDHHPGAGIAGQWAGQPDVHRLKLRSQHGSNPAEWPQDLRVREWPTLQAQGERAEVDA